MKILTGAEYESIKQFYILHFTTIQLSSDEHYNYLWDHLKEYNRKSERFCMDCLRDKGNIYIMWDTLDNFDFQTDDYFKYPRYSLLSVTSEEFYSIIGTLPEDIYIFDDSFAWTVIFTNEYLDKDRRYCLAIV